MHLRPADEIDELKGDIGTVQKAPDLLGGDTNETQDTTPTVTAELDRELSGVSFSASDESRLHIKDRDYSWCSGSHLLSYGRPLLKL
jgi:hypothetical protein